MIVDLEVGKAYELNPKKKYFIVFDSHFVNHSDLKTLKKKLDDMGIKSITCATKKPESIKILEVEK